MLRARSISSMLFAAAAIAAASTGACAGETHRTFVELFTSQGCSSCPPADALMAELQGDPNMIALSLPVDLWDYIGWKDTLASPDFTKRQKAYAASRGDNHVYTPQAVINGLVHAVGSDRAAIQAAAASSHGERGAMKLSMSVRNDGDRVVADVGGAEADDAKWGAMWVMYTARSRTVTIGRGENSGRTITYTNVVRAIRKVGDWAGKPAHYEVERSDPTVPDADGYVLVLQASSGGKPGPVLAAAQGVP